MRSLESLQIFVRVVERGSFLGVANELGTSQPRITRHIQTLESELGARLFERSTRGLSLTPAGERAYEMAQRMIALAEEARQEIQDERGGLRGKVRVVGPVVFGELVLADHVAAFNALHPEVSIELLLSDRNVNLIKEGAHCAFRGGPLEDSNFVAVPIGHSTGLIAATRRYVAQHGQPRAPEELAAHPIAAFHPRSPIAELNLVRREHPHGQATPAPIKPAVFATTSQTAARIAASGGMLAVLPHYGMDWYAKHHDFVQVLPDYCTKPNPIHAIYPSKHGMTARARAFVEFVASRTEALLRI